MSHLVYPNLARLENFTERNLNYSGIILEELWNGPNLLVHLAVLIVVLLTGGFPRKGHRLEGLWLTINIIIIHPMDFFVGCFGLGPKYLVDEYAILDTRYWVVKDFTVMWVTYHEFFVMLPLEYLWYLALQKGHWSRHYWAIITGTFQLMGTIMYMGAEWSDGFTHLPLADWPPSFSSYLDLKYFWFVFIFLNGIWIVLPLYFYYDVYCKLVKALSKYKLD